MTSEQPDPRRWRALSVTLGVGFMSLLDVSIVNVALPSMQIGLNASAGDVQWVVSGYALAFGLTLVAGGRLGDAFGRRAIFIVALAGFVLTSALAGAAPSIELLILARLVQGASAGLLTPQSSGLIQSMFSGAERGKAFGLLGATIGISTAVGPILGGLIIAAFGAESGWRWVFYVNVPIGVVALIFAARLLPKEERRRIDVRKEIDFLGAFLLGLAVVCVLFPVVQLEGGGATQWWLLVLFPVAVVLGFLFVRWEHRTVREGREPLLDMRLFTNTAGFASGAAIGAVYFCGFAGIFVVLAMFFQSGLHYTALESGLAVTSFALGSAVSAAVAGQLVARWGRRITVTALSVVALGMAAAGVVALLVPADGAGLWMSIPLLLAGIGGGAVIAPNVTLTLENVPVRMAGAAGGAMQTGQRIGTAIGAALLVAAFHIGTNVAGGRYQVGMAVAIGVAVLIIMIAVLLAARELRTRKTCTIDESLSQRSVISSQ
ncbi:EmrB/QacA subfamily drug resistance transporter [Kibdelosporangium banguiense]|uniref:EmrB/QacA subfamily drug resistance transporter n=1 Tax=Kibdelosporangium banguiense TaxID=1365924 RepID=A0ABS4TJD7_9PSEU|nr:DHA2 family efflux MFS transporter permease subunit [Kibdelosporangium banguiense]MBP2324543.1 EmrB/QacA subfamily drug resistance transporter [Kibdelosporangium banguiense]